MNARNLVLIAVLSTSTLAACDRRVTAIELVSATPQAENPDGCPDAPAEDMERGFPCSLPKGTVCAYRVSLAAVGLEGTTYGWAAYACGCEEDGEWSAAGVASPAHCPNTPPVTGDACDPAKINAPCPYYPGITSICTTSGAWQSWANEVWDCASP